VRIPRRNLRINTPSAHRPAVSAYVPDVETVWRPQAGVGAGAEQGPFALITSERGGTVELIPGFLQPA
jgi:hypothetical protein